MSSKRWAALIIAIALFFISTFYQLATNKTANQDSFFSTEDFVEKVTKTGNLGAGKIAVIHLDGVIMDTGSSFFSAYNHKDFLKKIEKAAIDPGIDGLIINVNSPGGGVVESAEIHEKIVEAQEAYDKPVYISMGNTAASGGYYIAAPADKIFANRATLTGSIGVIMESINYAELAENVGIDFNTIKSGEFKDILSSSRPMTDEEREILQTMIDDLYADFVDVIVAGRGMSEEEVRRIGDGRVYTGKQAQELGLIDEIGTLDDVITAMEEDFEFGNTTVVEYEVGFNLQSVFGLTAQYFSGSKEEWGGLLQEIRNAGGPRAMYLYSH
ncbi:signal peptide peptidase SppA [Ornithinibacillus sp. 4-3]|uniref:Signal peptide peptidase SppA n=1 Tax=Ornithinibacillus sp. 4-3 TaxID=3231488 RepID=A0AB39HL32_9BACI